MADRSFTAAMITAMGADRVNVAWLSEFHFDSGVLYLTDYAANIAWSGNTYERTNGFLGIDNIQENGELIVNQVIATLSGVDTSIALSKVLGEDFFDREMKLYLAIVDSAGVLVADPELMFSGRMKRPAITESPDAGTSVVQISGVPEYDDFGRRPGRHTNDEEQQFYFAGDKGFEFVSEIPRVVTWGRK